MFLHVQVSHRLKPLPTQPCSNTLPPAAGLADLSLPDTSDVALPDLPMSDSLLEDWE